MRLMVEKCLRTLVRERHIICNCLQCQSSLTSNIAQCLHRRNLLHKPGCYATPLLMCRARHFRKAGMPRIWLGPPHTITLLHCDYSDNLFARVCGSKRFLLFPQDDAEVLYTRQANPVLFGSRFDPEAPNYDLCPLSRRGRMIEVTMKAGEMLYLPAGWFHHVRALEFSLSANCWSHALPLVLRERGAMSDAKGERVRGAPTLAAATV